jgi:cytochrome c oxidase assembly protein subunit 15
MAHRIMAGIVFVYLGILAVRIVRIPGMLAWGVTLGALLLVQVGLGIPNVKLGLPLHVAVAHNAGAALLLFVLVTLVARVRTPEA